jgi:dipeptidyl aminopeptidase/acylaminoacyl peptidase
MTGFDENPFTVGWKTSGLYFSALQRTNGYLYRLDLTTKRVTKLTPADGWMGSSFSLTPSGDQAAFLGSSVHQYEEVFSVPLTGSVTPKRLTNLGAEAMSWSQPIREVITWKSRDGTPIEGVLHKPPDFRTGHRYPLMVAIHGGPIDVSRPTPYSSENLIDVWLGQGVLVLEPNYRGSAGYGEAFRSLSVRNLGIGESWDVLSGIDALVAQGLVDGDRVGCMGWSQGGAIAAFLATHDGARFKAVSVGAGPSDWTTYYANTDDHEFTRQYLKATPWDDPAIYARTSSITYIKGAKTPTLIQHGATDPRVPLSQAYELYRGLLDQGVTTKLIVYSMGHNPSKPTTVRAVMTHNLEWFGKYILGSSANSGR